MFSTLLLGLYMFHSVSIRATYYMSFYVLLYNTTIALYCNNVNISKNVCYYFLKR